MALALLSVALVPVPAVSERKRNCIPLSISLSRKDGAARSEMK